MIYKGVARYEIIPKSKDIKTHDLGTITRLIYNAKSYNEAYEKFSKFIRSLEFNYEDECLSVQIVSISEDN
jgi:hypothetical protein